MTTIPQYGLACLAVTQDSMYAVVGGIQTNGHGEYLLTLIKAQYPTMAAENNIWTVFSTTPLNYFPSTPYSGWIYDVTCDVDRNGVVSLRGGDGAEYRYDPLAPKIQKARTCSLDSNGLGEWRRTDLADPEGKIDSLGTGDPKTLRRFFISSDEDSMSTTSNDSGSQNEREVVIYYSHSKDSITPRFFYTVVNKMAYRSDITGFNQFTLSENISTIETLTYGEGQMFSVLGSGFPNLIPGTNRVTNNKTLLYFPFDPFNSSFVLTSPPASAISIPWNVNCDTKRDDAPYALGMVAKGKFYYICSVCGG
ncbi:hypothetical protein BG000_003510 [Podila horticola]|nr:hypothetical protein BG000_003510 [Podila horticola]